MNVKTASVQTVEVKTVEVPSVRTGGKVVSEHASGEGDVHTSVVAQIEQLNRRGWAFKRTDPERARALSEKACELAGADPEGLAYGLLTLAFCAVDALEYDEARRLVEAGKRAAETADAEDASARAEFISGYLLTRLADFGAALEAHERSLAHFTHLGDALGEATVRMYMAGVYIDQGEYTLARDSLALSLARFRQLEDTEGLAQALLMNAIVASYYGHYAEGLRANHEALGLKERLGDVRGQVAILNNLGGYYVTSGDWEKALEFYLESLKRLETLRIPPARAMLLTNIAEVYSELGDPSQAVRCAQEALQIDVKLGRKRDQLDTLEMLGSIYLRAGDDGAAQEQLEKALTLSETIGVVDTQALVLCKLAELSSRRGDLEEAQTLYEQALERALQTQNRSAETEIHLGLGRLLSARGELKRGCEELFCALGQSQAQGSKRVTATVHGACAEVLEQEQRFAEALYHLKEKYALDQELLTERSRDRSQLLAAQFELEKITRDAEISHLKNVELARANEALEAINVENAVLLEQLRSQAAQLEQQTREDALTGLYNRRHLEGAMRKAFETARRHREALTVVLIDLDNFKSINDTLSHQIGDEVLRTVTRIFIRFVRSADVIARYGGEEFALVLPKTPASGARAVCERICKEVEGYPWSALHPELKVTVSIGLSDDLSVKDHEKLLALADHKLYEAKRAGKNRVAF